MIATHDVDQARRWDLVLCLNRRQVAFGPPAETLTAAVLEATYGGRDRRAPGGETAAWRWLPPHHHAPARSTCRMSCLAAGGLWHALSRPLGQQILRRALLEVALIGVVGGPLGCWIVFYGLSYSAESLAHGLLPGLVVAALIGAPAPARRARRGCSSPRSRSPPPAQAPAIGRDTAVAVVVTTLFGLGVLLALSPASPPGMQGLLFGDVLGVSATSISPSQPGWARSSSPRLWALHGRLLAVGLDRGSARALGVSPAARRPRAARADRARAAGRRAGPRQPARGGDARRAGASAARSPAGWRR